MAFVVFEGGEGVGKSTQIRLLCQWLEQAGCTVVSTLEPGGTPLANEIRDLFKFVPKHGDAPVALTELMLIMAARAQHLERCIRPALLAGQVVVCDRFLDSTYVYQGQLRGIDKAYIDLVAGGILAGVLPDVTIVLSLAASEARSRLRDRGAAAADRMDSLDEGSLDALDQGFVRLVEQAWPYPDGRVPRRVIVSAQGTVEDIHARVISAVLPILEGGCE